MTKTGWWVSVGHTCGAKGQCVEEACIYSDLFGVSSIRLFSSLVFAMMTTISSLIFVTYTSLSAASLNTFNRSLAIANSDLSTLWTSR